MKIVEWDDDTVPHVLEVDEHGDVVIEDSMFEFDLEEGDLIQYLTEVGTSLYRVAEVVPIVADFDGHPDTANLVVIVGA